MKAKIKSMHINFVATFKDESGNWIAKQLAHEVEGFDGKVTRAAAERALEQRHDGSENMFYNILDFYAATKTINIY